MPRALESANLEHADQVPAPASKGDTRPVPDPTALTTQQLRRELLALREILEARMDGEDKVVFQQQNQLDKVPAEIELRVGHLAKLNEERFKSIAVQFAERDVRTEQTSRDSKVAVDAALQAAKEAVAEQNRSSALAIAKSEAGTTKQIDQQGVLIQTTAASLSDKIDDVKSRLTLIEGKQVGQSTQQTTQQASAGFWVAVVVGVVASLLSVVAIGVSLMKAGPT